jgi:hypothetical protein
MIVSKESDQMKVFSFGGGVQSMAALVLSAQKQLAYTDFVFANVGEDSENPHTIEYLNEIARPFALAHGITIHEVRKNGLSLYQDITSENSNVSIPVKMGKVGIPAQRNCTTKWKVKVIERWMKANAGATKEHRATLGVGISVDESYRMRTDDPEREPFVKKEYPLIDLMLTRAMCQKAIQDAGLPIPPKSSCWFCPYFRKQDWIHLRQNEPELFDRAIHLEHHLNAKRSAAGRDEVYLSPWLVPLEQAVDQPSINMFEDNELDNCESGYCMT